MPRVTKKLEAMKMKMVMRTQEEEEEEEKTMMIQLLRNQLKTPKSRSWKKR